MVNITVQVPFCTHKLGTLFVYKDKHITFIHFCHQLSPNYLNRHVLCECHFLQKKKKKTPAKELLSDTIYCESTK